MPVSDDWGKDWVRKRLFEEQTWNMLDVGAGVGTYADLLKDFLVWSAAVEIWGPYIREYGLDEKYDLVFERDIRSFQPEDYAEYDLVVFGDVLEHLPKADAKNVLRSALARRGALAARTQLTLVCIPVLHLEQGEVNGNPAEVHKMENHWTAAEMLGFLWQCAGGDGQQQPAGWLIDTRVGPVVAYFLVRQENA